MTSEWSTLKSGLVLAALGPVIGFALFAVFMFSPHMAGPIWMDKFVTIYLFGLVPSCATVAAHLFLGLGRGKIVHGLVCAGTAALSSAGMMSISSRPSTGPGEDAEHIFIMVVAIGALAGSLMPIIAAVPAWWHGAHRLK